MSEYCCRCGEKIIPKISIEGSEPQVIERCPKCGKIIR